MKLSTIRNRFKKAGIIIEEHYSSPLSRTDYRAVGKDTNGENGYYAYFNKPFGASSDVSCFSVILKRLDKLSIDPHYLHIHTIKKTLEYLEGVCNY